ncbi:MAG: hypothetical protein AB8G05_19085 [Oligoflexales bacterium]
MACDPDVHRDSLKEKLTKDLISKDRTVDIDQQGLENKVNKIKSLNRTETSCTIEMFKNDFPGITDLSLVNILGL